MNNAYFTVVFKADSLSEEERSSLVEECSAASWSHAIDDRKAAEKECDQLKATLHRFMALNQHDRDLPLELWAVQRGVSPVDVSLAQRDAEVIEQFLSTESPRIDAGGLNPIDPQLHHCEWTLHQERERLHAAANQLRQQAKEVQS